MQETIPGTRAIAQRLVNAENAFVALIQSEGFSDAEAEKIFAVYRKIKAVKYDGMRYVVKHGAYWDREVLARALQQA